VEGPAQTLTPALQAEVHRSARRSCKNAFRHPNARVLDDGTHPSHWGLPGIRETQNGCAHLVFWNEGGAGTEGTGDPFPNRMRILAFEVDFGLFRKNSEAS